CLRQALVAMPFAATANLLARRNAMVTNADDIRQDDFGICGTTTAVHLLARHRVVKFGDLFDSTFADLVPHLRTRRFATAAHGHQPIDFTYLSRRYALAMANTPVTDMPVGAVRADAAPNVDTQYFVDYCMSRALGYIFKTVQPARYESEKVDFNSA